MKIYSKGKVESQKEEEWRKAQVTLKCQEMNPAGMTMQPSRRLKENQREKDICY